MRVYDPFDIVIGIECDALLGVSLADTLEDERPS